MKYFLNKNGSIWIGSHKLYRVIYLDEFIQKYKEENNVSLCEKGGWIESICNLSQDNYSVVLDEAKVFNKAYICDNARVTGVSIIANSSLVDGDSKVFWNAIIKNSIISGNTRVYCNAIIRNSKLYDKTTVYGSVLIRNSIIHGDVILTNNSQRTPKYVIQNVIIN